MQFPIWHWAIVLRLIGVPVFFAVRSATKPSRNPDSLAGFGGWLLLLAIGQTLAPFRTLADLFSSSEGYQQLLPLPKRPIGCLRRNSVVVGVYTAAVDCSCCNVAAEPSFQNSYSCTSGWRSHLWSRSTLFGPPRF